MKKPYVSRAESQAVKLRWISVQCYEMVLPNGKVVITDPFYWDGSNYDSSTELTKQQKNDLAVYSQSNFSVDDFTGADYIIISHIHGDHCNIVDKLWNKFYGRVIVPAEAALTIAQTYNIPYGAIYPVHPGNTYYFDDFTLKVYPGAHDNRSFREGYFIRPDNDQNNYLGSEPFGVNVPNMTGPMGYMHCINFLLETENNFKIDFSAGKDFEEHVQHMTVEKPNMMLRHRIRSYTPKDYAKQLQLMGAQIMMPLHHNNARATDEDLNLFFEEVNTILEANNYYGVALNPEPYKWYRVCTSIIAE